MHVVNMINNLTELGVESSLHCRRSTCSKGQLFGLLQQADHLQCRLASFGNRCNFRWHMAYIITVALNRWKFS